MPTQAQFRNIKPQDLGLPSFESVYQLPNLTPEEQSRLQLYMKQADQAAAQGGLNAGTALRQAKDQFKTFYQSLLGRQNAYVPPPQSQPQASTPPVAGAAPPAQMTPTAAPAGTGVAAVTPPQTTAPAGRKIDFESELMKLLGGNTAESDRLQKLQLKRIEQDINAPDFGANDQKIIDIASARARGEAQTRTEAGDTYLAGQNLSGGGAALRNYQAETDNLSKQIMDIEVGVRTDAAHRGEARRQTAYVNSENFLRALETKNVGLATQLVNLYTAQTQADLNDRQLELQRYQVEEGVRLSRDQFSEDTRRALRQEGFTEDQIKASEQQMLWQRAFNEKQQTADIDLSNRNLGLQTKIADANISAQDKSLALEQIRDNNNFTVQTAIQDLAERTFLFNSGLEKAKIDEVVKMNDFEKQKFLESMGFERDKFDATQALSRDQFESYAKELERRFGLDINRFELEKSLSTGELDWKILESQRRYDLDVESEKQKWLHEDAALQLQEKLGMTELEIKQALGQGQLDLERESQILEKWMFTENINFEKKKFEEQLKAARAKKKGSFLGGLVKTLVGGAVGFFTGGGPVGALAGAMSANGIDLGLGGGSSAGTDFANATQVPNAAPDATFDLWGK